MLLLEDTPCGSHLLLGKASHTDSRSNTSSREEVSWFKTSGASRVKFEPGCHIQEGQMETRDSRSILANGSVNMQGNLLRRLFLGSKVSTPACQDLKCTETL